MADADGGCTFAMSLLVHDDRLVLATAFDRIRRQRDYNMVTMTRTCCASNALIRDASPS